MGLTQSLAIRRESTTTHKVFSENTHIVAVATTGHVYAYESIDELVIKPKSWRDLMTDEPFKRKDLITIQDPHNITNRNISDFHYKVNEIAKPANAVENDATRRKRANDSTINGTGSTARILVAMNSSKAGQRKGATAVTNNRAAVISDDEYLVANGDYSFELSPRVPSLTRAIARSHRYSGGESHYGQTFADEIKSLSHNERDILSMANKGSGTNTLLHTSNAPSGREAFNIWQSYGWIGRARRNGREVDKNDKPKQPITMLDIEILVDPFEKALHILKGTDPDTLRKEREAAARKAKKAASDRLAFFEPQNSSSAIGKYLNGSAGEGEDVAQAEKKRATGEDGSGIAGYEDAERPKKKAAKTNFDFSSW
ncbi:hypothetical protein CcCBS67573_g08549 [Chytriomyces confervae]|uniref:Uncharacterized protein n=1 Tax=Chytriomyces confervae TaxID=246404 RepID=A0A507EKM7_9FUNG|nr:hypothetical protein CcCBS67573_g08549 [Chytriomyces confervae]